MFPGTILISAPSLDDPGFDRAVIFIAEHNENGAMGFVLNKLFPRRFNELQEFKDSIAFPIYAGGPVKTEHLFFMHRRPDLISESIAISGSVYLGGNFKDAVARINSGQISEQEIKIFIGYCGWNGKELEEEITEGSWLPVSADPAIAFSDHATNLYDEYSRVNFSR